MQGEFEGYEFEDIFGTESNISSNVQYERSSTAPAQTTTQERELLQPPFGTENIGSDNFYAENQGTVSRNETCNMTFPGSDNSHFQKGGKWTERILGTQNPSGNSALSDVSEEAKIGQAAFSVNTAPIFSGLGTSLSSGIVSIEDYSKVSGKLLCFECRVTFTSEYHLEIHREIHAKLKQLPAGTPIPSGSSFHSHSSLDNGGNSSSSKDEAIDTTNESSHIAWEIERRERNRISTSKYREKNRRMERFKCDNCQKAFPCFSALQTHERIHTGEKPFKCNMCNSAFRRKSHLKGHMVLHMDGY